MKPQMFFNNGVYFLFRYSERVGKFFGFAKLTQFSSPYMSASTEPGELWFEFGDSLQDVKASLFSEMARATK